MAADIKLRFEHDGVNDIFVFYPCGHLVTEADCRLWLEKLDELMSPLQRKVDGIFVLEMFSLDEGVLETFAKYRHIAHGRYTRHSVRVGTSGNSHLAMVTKAGLAVDTPRSMATDIESATQMILEARSKAVHS